MLIGAAVAAVLVVGGGVWFATSGGGGGESDGKDAASSAGPSVTPSDELSPSEEVAEPTPSEEETDDIGAAPTGTGIEGMWRSDSGGGMLGMLEGEDTTAPDKISVVLVHSGLECRGVRKVEEAGKKYRIALLCERGGERVESEDRSGDLTFSGGSISVVWTAGGTGTETFQRYSDMPED
ncbi:hypothetical protein ACFVWX_21080 [Streptomyces sp. NPDC058220]|uniref:hypothetical protein n=1 Tax=unclassified Streptomyces TaxID=2593676 RepID=UPI00365314E8